MIYHIWDLFCKIYSTTNLISVKKSFWKIFDNFFCFIMNHKLHLTILWMHFTLFITVFRRNKVNCYCSLNFTYIRFFYIIYDIFQLWFNFIKVFLNYFIFNIIVAPKITWFVIIVLFSCSKRFLILISLTIVSSIALIFFIF